MTRYAAAILQLTIALVGALALVHGPVTLVTVLDLVPLAVNVVLVYFVPLFGVNDRSGWKTGAAVAVAVAAAAVPFATVGHITGQQALVVLLAGLQALGAHVGVQIRNQAAAGSDALYPTSTAVPVAGGSEPPTETSMVRAIDSNGGESGLGAAAR